MALPFLGRARGAAPQAILDVVDVKESLKRYVAAGTQPSVGPFGSGEGRHYRIDPKYAVPHLARDLGIDEASALEQLRGFAVAAGAIEREVELDNQDEIGRDRVTHRRYSLFEIPVAAIDE